MSKKAKFKVIVKELITYEFLAVEDENFPVNDYNLNYIDGDDLNLDVEGWGVKKITPKKQVDIESVSITYEDIINNDKGGKKMSNDIDNDNDIYDNEKEWSFNFRGQSMGVMALDKATTTYNTELANATDAKQIATLHTTYTQLTLKRFDQILGGGKEFTEANINLPHAKDRKAAGISGKRYGKVKKDLRDFQYDELIENHLYRTTQGQRLWLRLGFPYIADQSPGKDK